MRECSRLGVAPWEDGINFKALMIRGREKRFSKKLLLGKGVFRVVWLRSTTLDRGPGLSQGCFGVGFWDFWGQLCPWAEHSHLPLGALQGWGRGGEGLGGSALSPEPHPAVGSPPARVPRAAARLCWVFFLPKIARTRRAGIIN